MLKIFKKALSLIIPGTMVFLSSCFYNQVEDSEINSRSVSFDFDVQPVFNSHCTRCHPSVVPSPDLTEGNSYTSLIKQGHIVPNDTANSTLYQRLIGNPRIMPPEGSLSAREINLVRDWILQGALDN